MTDEPKSVISIRLTGSEAVSFVEAAEQYPGLTPNGAGRVAAYLFILMTEEQPDWIPEAIARLRKAQAARRHERRQKVRTP